ncbi:MAG: hypothetical protein A2046_14415 [Bacteroidetes bacterium GWA2_30_7]|nr:MAG: hypothetical protein A2046_14415 [Bacteroidetes bacterium GWA2_30_7]
MTLGVKHIFSLFFILHSFLSFTQNYSIYDSINKMPDSKTKSIQSLVEYINENADSDIEKARGIYYWIANNIKYDLRSFVRDKKSNFEPEDVFNKRKAVCAGYSNLYSYMCSLLKIRCELISGYTYGSVYNIGQQLCESNHAWNAIYVDSKWRLIDVTWGSGYVKKNFFIRHFHKRFESKYFDVPPHFFVFNHLPEIPMWQLLNYPLALKTFALSDVNIDKYLEKKKSEYYNFNDTIQQFYSKDIYDAVIDFGNKAIRFNPNNKTPLAYAKLSIVEQNIKNKINSQLYNIVVLDSIIALTESSIELLIRARSSRKSVIETIENYLDYGNNVLSELNFIRAKYYAKTISDGNVLSSDSLKFVMKKITKSAVKTLDFYKKIDNHETLIKKEEELCVIILNLYDQLFYNFEIEEDIKTKRTIKKMATSLISFGKKYISEECSCNQKIQLLERLK